MGESDYRAIDNWVKKTRAGDKTAAEILTMTFKPLVLSCMKGRIAPGRYEDAYQEGCLRILQAARAFEPERGVYFNTYLKSQLTCFFMARARSDRRETDEASVSLDAPVKIGEESSTFGELLPDSRQNTEGTVLGKEDARRLNTALKHLSHRRARVIRALYLDGQSASEVAETLGITENAVYLRTLQGLKSLRELLGAD